MTVDTSAVCLTLAMGAPAAGAITWAGTASLNVSGSFSLNSGMTRTYTGALGFLSTSTGRTIATNGITLASAVNFAGAGGGWTLSDAWNSPANFTLSNGTLDTNGQTVTVTNFNSSSSNVRALTLGASTFNCSNSWTLTTSTNMTLSAASSTINITGATRNFAGGGLTYGTVVITSTLVTTISGANTFGTLTYTGSAAISDQLLLSANQVVTGTLTLTGNSATNRIFVATDTIGTNRTLTAATVTVQSCDFMDITGAGAGSWNLSAVTGRSGNCGGNSGITFSTAENRFWVGGTGSWGTTGEWAATSGGAAGASVPIAQDTATFDANSFTAGAQIVTLNIARLSTIVWSGVTNTPTWTTGTAAQIYGSLTLTPAMILTASTNLFTFRGRSAHTLTSAGLSWDKAFAVQAPGGTLTLQDALTTGLTRDINLQMGTFNANNFNVTCGSVTSNNSDTRVLTMGSGTWTIGNSGTIWGMTTTTGLTLNANTSTIKATDSSATNKNLIWGNVAVTLYNVWLTGTGTGDFVFLNSVTMNDLKMDTPPHELLFTTATTTTVTSFTVSGTAGNLMTIGSVTAASHTLTKAGGGVISCDYLTISRSSATPANTWYAGANSTDGLNNTGWIFTAAPGGGSNTLMLLGVGK